MRRCCSSLPLGHRTESHIPRLPPPASLCCLCLARSSSLRLLSPFFHPSSAAELLFPPFCHCRSVSFTLFPPSICSPLASSSPLWLCLRLSHPPLLAWIHAFTWEPLHPSRGSALRCVYLAVGVFVEVNGQEGGQEGRRQSEQTGSYLLRRSAQFSLPCSVYLAPPFLSASQHHDPLSVSPSTPMYSRKRREDGREAELVSQSN